MILPATSRKTWGTLKATQIPFHKFLRWKWFSLSKLLTCSEESHISRLPQSQDTWSSGAAGCSHWCTGQNLKNFFNVEPGLPQEDYSSRRKVFLKESLKPELEHCDLSAEKWVNSKYRWNTKTIYSKNQNHSVPSIVLMTPDFLIVSGTLQKSWIIVFTFTSS